MKLLKENVLVEVEGFRLAALERYNLFREAS